MNLISLWLFVLMSVISSCHHRLQLVHGFSFQHHPTKTGTTTAAPRPRSVVRSMFIPQRRPLRVEQQAKTNILAPIMMVNVKASHSNNNHDMALRARLADVDTEEEAEREHKEAAETVEQLSPLQNSVKPFSRYNKASTDPTPVAVSWLRNHVLPSDTLVATVALSFLLFMTTSPMSSWAAMTGGRMGGSFAPSSSRSSSSSYSRGYSRSYSPGYGTGYLSRPSVSITTPFYNPFFAPSPWIVPQPYFFGGPGVISYSRGPSLFDLFFWGGLVYAITTFVRNSQQQMVETTEEDNMFSGWLGSGSTSSALGSGTSVLQLSVALEVPNRNDPQSMLSVLNRLASTARTDSRVGLSNLTSQVALELLRRKSSIVSAYSSYQHYNDRNKAQREFQSLAIQERGKFETETVSKYGGVDYSASPSQRIGGSGTSSSSQATMAVVTLIMAIDGDSTKLKSVRSMADVEEALRKIAADAKVDDCLQSCEILWTPEDPSETLTLRDVVADYPELRTV